MAFCFGVMKGQPSLGGVTNHHRGPHGFKKDIITLRRRAAAEFRSTKPSGRMEARSLRRTVPVMRFHRRIRRRSMVVERVCACRDGLQLGKGKVD